MRMVIILALFTAALFLMTKGTPALRSLVSHRAPEEAMAAAGESFQWTGTVDVGDAVEVKGISGSISARPASGNQVEVVATKHGRARNINRVQFATVEHDNGVTICAVYGGLRGSDACRPGEGGQDGHDVDVDVDFEVRVPSGVAFIGRTVSGDVEARGLDAEARAYTVSGDVSVSSSDFAHGTTVSGDIDVRMGRADWTGNLEFHTVSGDITLTLPADVATEIAFESMSGDLETDFAITMQGQQSGFVGQRLRGTIGAGGRQLTLKTVSGDVALRRQP